jgi:hypothetical protein
MVLDTATICDLCDQFPEFSMLRQLVRVAKSAGASPFLLTAYRPLSDCTYGKQIQRFPSCGRHRDCAESHDQLMLQVQSNKHSDCYRGQILHGEKVERRDDMEYEQIY